MIRSMDPQEKRHFKLYATRREESNHYSLLFDTIDKLEEYDEEVLKKKIRIGAVLRNLKQLKSQLYERILKSLELYHQSSFLKGSLQQYLLQAEILISKRLYSSAAKSIKKGHELALENEEHLYVLLFLSLETELKGYVKDLEAMSPSRLDKDLQHINIYKNIIEYQKLSLGVRGITLKNEVASQEQQVKELKTLLEHSLLDSEKQALSYTAVKRYYHTHSTIYRALADYKKSLHYLEQFLEYLEKEPAKLKNRAYDYLATIYTLSILHIDTAAKKDTLLLFRKAEAIYRSLPSKLRTANVNSGIMGIQQARIGLHLDRCEFRDALKIAGELEQKLNALRHDISADNLFIFWHVLAQVHFYSGDHKKAMALLNKIINSDEKTLRLDIRSSARVLSLMLHYELGNTELLESAAASTEKFLEKNKMLFGFEKKLLAFFRKKAMNINSKKEEAAAFTALLSSLTESDRRNNRFLEIFDSITWIKSKASGRPFQELLASKR